MKKDKITCPTTPDDEGKGIIGCGSDNVTGPDEEGFWNCGDCGMWFDPTRER